MRLVPRTPPLRFPPDYSPPKGEDFEEEYGFENNRQYAAVKNVFMKSHFTDIEEEPKAEEQMPGSERDIE